MLKIVSAQSFCSESLRTQNIVQFKDVFSEFVSLLIITEDLRDTKEVMKNE